MRPEVLMTSGRVDGECPVCDRQPRVLLAMRHPTMVRLTRQLIDREFGCWVATEMPDDVPLAAAVDRLAPDLVVLDAQDFPRCCRATLGKIAAGNVIVVSPEPDPTYQSAALAAGAGAWISRDHVGDELPAAMRHVLGCLHDPCPRPQEITR